jgi:hypothetical protein
MTREGDDAAAKLELALALHDDGVALMRENLVRAHPGASDDEIDRRLGEWLATRPGAEYGDGAGVPVSWPRASGR